MVPPRTFRAAIPVLGKQRVQQLLAVAEIGGLEARHCGRKVDEPALCRTVAQANRARDLQRSGARGSNAGALIDKDEIGLYLRRQCDRRTLSRINISEIGVQSRWRGYDGQPHGWGFSPTSRRGWRVRMAKFGMHYVRNKHGFEQPGENVDGTDQNQVTEGAGITDGGTHAASKAKTVERLYLAVQFLQRDAVMDIVDLQEAVDLVAGFETQQPS